jgi:leucyl-tRNA synthetase
VGLKKQNFMEYNFREIEKKWQKTWRKNGVYTVTERADKPKYYVLDMFPYPSGAGLHVGHPLGYIASDIYSRYKRLRGFNVLHPMGYDAYGLPAEQYAIQTGQHPAITTEENIRRYREQLDRTGFCFDWTREVRTCDPAYYKWTQWAFIQMFESYYCFDAQQARPIAELVKAFELQGSHGLHIACTEALRFTAEEWKAMTEREKQETLMNCRIAYLADTMVNWCPALGTVLANDEVSEGVSVRGGHPVEQRRMRQWSLRVSAYAQRLLDGLDRLDWTDSMKETQRNWIGRSEGAEIVFYLSPGNLSPSPSPQGRGEECSGCGSVLRETEEVREALPDSPKGLFANTTDMYHWNLLIGIAREYRSNQTEAEDVLWLAVRANKTGYKIRRQHIINGYIADFINLEKQVIIEVDGDIHLTDEQKEKDGQRTSILNQLGFDVIRFTNEEILSDPSGVAKQIKAYLDKAPSRREEIPANEPDSHPIHSSPLSRETNSYSEHSSPLPCGEGPGERCIKVFTTRPDTIFGVTFMVLAPESEYVEAVVTPEQKSEVDAYLEAVKRRTERERIADRRVTGVFSGSYAVNPVNGEVIPVWISDYVLAGYGTGAIMAVPAHDSRDYAFARHFNLPVVPLIEGADVSTESFDAKEGVMVNSGFLNGLTVKEAIRKAGEYIASHGLGQTKVNYRLRDAIFSRQRYWGEPFPIYYRDGMPCPVGVEDLPVELPEVNKFLPTETGEPPLGRAAVWAWDAKNRKIVETARISSRDEIYPLELCTMPGFAGSSAYYLRYEDPHNGERLVSEACNAYWRNVDLYVGGTEHATGHLIYSRFWNKFLYDCSCVADDEPFRKLINQGMIQGRSNFVYRIKHTNTFVSFGLKDGYDVTPIHVDVNIVSGDILDLEAFRNWNPEYASAEFILENGRYVCGWAVEKMSKSMYNVVNPDDVIERFGADTLRLYEMFLGPIEQSKPWDTNGIDGVSRFLRKFWNLFFRGDVFTVSDEPPTAGELKAIHKLIRKVGQDIESFSFNTSVAAFMICVNELTALKCNSRAVLSDFVVVLSPFAPHIAEELWHRLGHDTTVCDAVFPAYDEAYLKEDTATYAISFNGKTRFSLELPADMPRGEVEKTVLAHESAAKWTDGRTPKKIIVVPGKVVNIVI